MEFKTYEGDVSTGRGGKRGTSDMVASIQEALQSGAWNMMPAGMKMSTITYAAKMANVGVETGTTPDGTKVFRGRERRTYTKEADKLTAEVTKAAEEVKAAAEHAEKAVDAVKATRATTTKRRTNKAAAAS